jgi:hypothetical protein
MAEGQWYYARDNQQFGPVSATELRQLADAGGLAPDDLLWREGMDAWATAINLRGLFAEESATGPAKANASATIALSGTGAAQPILIRPQAGPAAPPGAVPASLRSVLRATQIILWTMCVLVVLAGLILFTRAFLTAQDAAAEAAAGAVFSTFFIAAYVLARCGEKLSRLLLAYARRRSR